MTRQEFEDSLKIMSVAAAMAAPVLSNIVDNLAIDPETIKPETLDQNAMEVRVVRTFYAFIVGTIGKPEYWAALPAITGGGSPGPGGPLDPSAVATALQASLTTTAGKALVEAVKTMAMGGTPAPLPLAPVIKP